MMIRILVLLLIFSCRVAAQTSATVVPDGDNTVGGWTVEPLFSKVDEDIDTPNGTTISSINNPATPTNDVLFDVTCPADVDSITEANLRVRSAKSAADGRRLDFNARWSATAVTDFGAVNINETLTDRASGNQTGLSITKATCDASTLKIESFTVGGGAGRAHVVDTVNLDIVYTVASGRRRFMILTWKGEL